MQQEDFLALATGYLVAKGNLAKCEAHGSIFRIENSDFEDGFWKKAMIDRLRGDSGPVPWAAKFKSVDYIDLLKGAYDDHLGVRCSSCAGMMGG
ncbi:MULTISPECIES: hypothetical protein [Rhizobium]|uniref:Uncharacterized protein n=1 Tax=Rhizobium rhododendri TaxID=2506430 RepID=A0ABY8IN92_9HYPH|nr:MULTISPECIES: hypothetical protein [Rhizobium]MBO9102089.1 hypothetical protein [Rhizobium sp. L58/93]QXZ87119.1 hypothetical protein J5287_21290 [Rhizobium sp. K1/93]QXZ92847.1 hypothetical protein J5280_19605 [Rhizobium sp. K15/93]QYA03930.1 hypothetical protein J5278_24450 [Rhizobium sp. B21/90]WFS25184.1 hypothetical protein PR018_23235 [Rhizobium rhododendri]